jgi:hypothetical protein
MTKRFSATGNGVFGIVHNFVQRFRMRCVDQYSRPTALLLILLLLLLLICELIHDPSMINIMINIKLIIIII